MTKMENSRKILNCYETFRYGGLGIVFVNISNYLFHEGINISVVVQYAGGELQEKLDKKIHCFSLEHRGKLSYPLRLRSFIQIVRETSPEIVLSHSWNMNVIVILAKLITRSHYKIIIFEHISPAAYLEGNWFFGKIKQLSIKYLYQKADLLVAVSDGIRKSYNNKYKLNPDKIVIITPPTDIDNIKNLAKNYCTEFHSIKEYPIIISVGTLSSVKNFILLLEAFKKLIRKIDCRLVIVGEGVEKEKIVRHAQDLGVEKKILLTGYQENPYKYMAKSSIYVSTSKFEGFSLSIVEAMVLGLPVVSTCTDGAKQILEEGKYGILVDHNSDAISTAIFSLLTDKEEYKRYSDIGKIRAGIFKMNQSLSAISDLIEKLQHGGIY